MLFTIYNNVILLLVNYWLIIINKLIFESPKAMNQKVHNLRRQGHDLMYMDIKVLLLNQKHIYLIKPDTLIIAGPRIMR